MSKIFYVAYIQTKIFTFAAPQKRRDKGIVIASDPLFFQNTKFKN